jgi:hypothetical protein
VPRDRERTGTVPEPSLELLGKMLESMIAEQRVIRDEQRALRLELRRPVETQASQSRILVRLNESLGHMRDDLVTMIRAELGGLFAHLETRLEPPVADEIADRVPMGPPS